MFSKEFREEAKTFIESLYFTYLQLLVALNRDDAGKVSAHAYSFMIALCQKSHVSPLTKSVSTTGQIS